MKRKSVLRVGAVLLSAGFAIVTVNGKTDRGVLAEETPLVEEKAEIASENIENQDIAGVLDDQNALEILEMPGDEEIGGEQDSTETPGLQDGIQIDGEAEIMLEEQKEIGLPQKSVFVPVSEFLPVQEREDLLSLNPYSDLYLLHFKNDSEIEYTIFFNQVLKESDVILYRYDSEKNKVTDAQPVQDVMNFDENGKSLSLVSAASSDYMLVISHAEKYPKFGYTSKIVNTKPEETAPFVTWEEVTSESEGAELMENESETVAEPKREAVTEAESEAVTETESETMEEPVTEIGSETVGEPVTETESEAITETERETMEEPESEPVTETESEAITETESEMMEEPVTETESETSGESESEPVTEIESETVTETESETEEVMLTAVSLKLDQNLDTIPSEFLNYISDLDVYSVILVYSDGSEKQLDKTTEEYALSVDYEDVNETEETIRRTYHVTVKDSLTGAVFEDKQEVTFGEEAPVEIKTEEMTTVLLEGKKKWVMVQSTPSITGRYAINSNKMVENMYYASEDGEIISAENVFTLQEGVTYRFLIRLS